MKIKMIILAIIAIFTITIVPTFACADNVLQCGSYCTLYNYHGDENTNAEYIVIYNGNNPRAVFYINTNYGELKMVKPLKDNGNYFWQIKFCEGEFNNANGLNNVVKEADDLLNNILNNK